MWPTRSELEVWVRCKLKVIAIAGVILVGMGLIGVVAALVSS